MSASKMIYARLAGRKKLTMNPPISHPKLLPPKRPERAEVLCEESPPTLRFTPYAWAKLLFFRDAGETEIGGFGISGVSTDDLLLVEDFVSVQQVTTAVTVAFDDSAVADYFEEQVLLERKPEQFGRIWIHTHPGASPSPSTTDEATYARVFGTCSWAIMFILAKGGATYTRVAFHVGPGGELALQAGIDFAAPFPAADHAAWQGEYDLHVHPAALSTDAQSLRSIGIEEFRSRRTKRREDRENHDDEGLHEALLEEYLTYWGSDREVFQ
jgi:hypothetical protein